MSHRDDRQLAVRLYDWSKEDLLREIATDYSLLRRCNDASARSYLAVMQSLPVSERRHLGMVVLKRFHEDAARSAGEGLSQVEEEQLASFDLARRDLRIPLAKEVFLSPATKSKVVRPSLVLRAAIDALHDTTGIRLGRRETNVAEIDTAIGDWIVTTGLDSGGGSQFDLTYWHQIRIGNRLALPGLLSCQSWLGVSSMTTWKISSESDLERATKAVCSDVRSFSQGVARDPTSMTLARPAR